MKEISRVHDLTGQKFGKLFVLGIADTNTRKTYWICECECGNIKSVRSDSLLCGAIKSCGCLKKEQDEKNLNRKGSVCKSYPDKNQNCQRRRIKSKRHESDGMRLYGIWQGMRKRCYDTNAIDYERWGGRGIVICPEWETDFNAFYDWAINNGYKSNLTIDRKDNDGNYSPENCRWANDKEQANNRRSNIRITIGESTKTMKEWCEIFDLDYKMVNARYHRCPDISWERLFSPRKYRGNQ